MSDSVQQIKDKLSIIDVIAPYVELHKAGKNFKGKSPFTSEKTPSFFVSPDRGMYYCFSTSQGGDMFTFVQAMEGVDFKEALKQLAEKAGVELVPEDPKKKTERDRWYSVLKEATDFYVTSLEKEPSAQEYLVNRGLKEETIRTWRVGFAPGPPKYGWRELKEHLESNGYTKNEMLNTGLIKITEGGKEPFDVFRDRIVFPMNDSGGRVVAFSGRILTADSKAPKYVNSPETELYKKSELLYGYDKAKQGIRTFDFSLIVEGQFDVVMSHQAGYSNTVAVSGTALTLDHVKLLERLSDKVVLALDADKAGINAMKKGAEVMLRRGLDVKVAEMPLGKDPADMIQADVAEFKKVIGSSVHVIEFLLHVLKRDVSDDRSFKLRSREEVLPFILLLPNRIDQEHFVTKVAEAIGSTTDAIRFELDRLREESSSQTTRLGQSVAEVATDMSPTAQKFEVIKSSRVFLAAAASVVEEDIAKAIKQEVEKLETGEIFETIDEKDVAGVSFVLEQQFSAITKLMVADEIVSKLNLLRKSLIRKKLSDQKILLMEAEMAKNDELFASAMKVIQECEVALKEDLYSVEQLLTKGD